MIGYLDGPIHRLEPGRAIILCAGIGWDVQIPLSTFYRLESTNTAQLWIHTHVREDAIALFGFATIDEKTAFERLIDISGIGPRLAQVILSGIAVHELAEAIAKGDSRRLSAIPGVGKKTSERICLELRDKLILSDAAPSRPSAPSSSSHEDVVSALVNLGYRAVAAETAVRAAAETNPDADFSALLKLSLRSLTR